MKLAIALLTLLTAFGIYFAKRQPPKPLETKISTTRQGTLPSVGPRLTSSVESLDPAKIISETQTDPIPEAIEQQIEALTDASTKSDSGSLQLIVDALKNPQAEIRHAAVDAAIQFGSRDAIPFLKTAAEQTTEAREKVEILDAIKFLELPAFSEIKQARATNLNSRRIRATSE